MMQTAQVVSVFPGCGQDAFAKQNLAVTHLNLLPASPDGMAWDILRHLRNGIIRRQCAVVTMRKDVHNGLHRMGHGAFLIYPTYWHQSAPVDWKEMVMDAEQWDGLKIELPVGFFLSDAIKYDHERGEFNLTEKAHSWVLKQ